MRAPYRLNRIGIGTITAAKQPISVFAHWTPIPWYIYEANIGNIAPAIDLAMALAAIADAALNARCYKMSLRNIRRISEAK